MLGLRRRRRTAAQGRFDEARVATPFVDPLDDSDLERLNDLLPWHCFTVDSHGRAFGRPAWSGKRVAPQQVPDPRIELFDRRFGLAGSHVLEVGCFEGVHTVGLCRLAGRVTAVDARIENVVKTIVRCAFFDQRPTVFAHDLERHDAAGELPVADLCHHVGVLYHLSDPVAPLARLGSRIRRGLMLDTHFALPGEAADGYESGGREYRFRRYGEPGRDPFSGMLDHSKWLLLDDIVGELRRAGFDDVEVVERREERNGPRALLFAKRGKASS